MADKVGIITYHAAYNFGSVLQAYATQEIINQLGFSAELINYRMNEQKNIYTMYRTSKGIKTLIKDLMLLPIHKERKLRERKFESFISDYLKLTEEFCDPADFSKQAQPFEAVVSGSDQIWNKHSLELRNVDWSYMNPYLLVGYQGKKISYASSVANMSDEDIQKIAPQLRLFDYISLRENEAIQAVGKYVQAKPEHVLDPTLLLTSEEWTEKLGLKAPIKDDYILFYSLGLGLTNKKEIISILQELSRKFGYKVLVVSPYVYEKADDNSMVFCPDYGPIEFLNAVCGAKLIITDSYHGTLFSINFSRPFMSITSGKGAERRKTDILCLLGLEHDMLSTMGEIRSLKRMPEVDFAQVQSILKVEREKSIEYLAKALGGN